MNLLRGIPILFCALFAASAAAAQSPHPVHSLKITLLSTMLADEGVGEWGFAALVEADGKKVLVDTGAHPQTVLQNARDMQIDLSDVPEVVLTHFHEDHTGGLMTLRTELKTRNPTALADAHVATGLFYSRPGEGGREGNGMIARRAQFEATGGRFIVHDGMGEILPGVWLTGPVPRKFPERNWSGSGKVQTPAGLVEDTVPDDQSLIIETPEGLVVVTGCGHAGIVNILTDVKARFNRPVITVVGGLHLFAATDRQVDWTGDQLKGFGVRYLVGAHCTGIESLYRLRQRLGLTRKSAVVGAVGATYSLSEGIRPGRIAQ